MANLSKMQLRNIEYRKCSEIHPWAENCVFGSLAMGQRVFVRTGFFLFGPIYLLQLWMKRHKITKALLVQHVKAYLQSCAFGSLYTISFLQAQCLLRRILGRYTFLTLAFIPGFVSGLSLFTEHPSRHNIVTTTTTNLALEYVVRWLQVYKNMKLSHGGETVVFMLLSAFLMYLLRKHHDKASSTTLLWFFVPTPVRTQVQHTGQKQVTTRSICAHVGTCRQNVVKRSAKLLLFGLGYRVLRSLWTFANKSKSDNTRVLGKTLITLPLFLASYVAIFESVSCLQNHYRGEDCALHSVLAGFLAGSCYRLERNFTFILNAITTILQILAMQGAANGRIPHASVLGTLVFASCNGLLYHSLVTNHKLTPHFFTLQLRLATNGISDLMHRTALEFLYGETPPSKCV